MVGYFHRVRGTTRQSSGPCRGGPDRWLSVSWPNSSARQIAVPTLDTSGPYHQELIWPNDVLRLVAPAIEARAPHFLGRMGVGVTRHVDRLATKMQAGGQFSNVTVVK